MQSHGSATGRKDPHSYNALGMKLVVHKCKLMHSQTDIFLIELNFSWPEKRH